MFCSSSRVFLCAAVAAFALGVKVSPGSAAAASAGDVNCDQLVDTADLAALLEIVSGAPDSCGSADVNVDGGVTSADVTAMIARLATAEPTRTPTSTATNTPTPTPPPIGPHITYFGLADAQGIPLPTAGSDPQDNPIYDITLAGYTLGIHFNIVVEARPGPNPAGGVLQPGQMVVNENVDQAPDLQIQANRDLGNGSALVCDNSLEPTPGVTPGGVRGINSSLDLVTVAHILNDLGCRFITKLASGDACTCANDNGVCGGLKFVEGSTTVQYCTANPGGIGMELQFPSGDTLLSVQVRGSSSNVVGNPRHIVVRVPTQFPTLTPLPTDTPTHTPPPTFTFTASRTPTITNTPTVTPTPSQTPSLTPSESPTPTASGTPTETPTPSATPA